MFVFLSDERRIVKIAFWFISPLVFWGILRFWLIVFGYVYGLCFIAILGENYSIMISVFAFITALVVTIISFWVLYRLLRKNFIDG